MKSQRTELIFILDKSGSMAGLEEDTLGGYNAMLEKQTKGQDQAFVTTVLFDDDYECLYEGVHIREIRPMSPKDYSVGGCTALLDAIGKTIRKNGMIQKETEPALRADKVMVVIITDGMENASRQFNFQQIRTMIRRQTKKYGWEFVFLGANMDAIATASRCGIQADRAANYCADARGTRLNYETVGAMINEFRCSESIRKDWKKAIDEDYEQRGR